MLLRLLLAASAPLLLSAGAITGSFPSCSSLGNFGRLIGPTCQRGDFPISDAGFSATATPSSAAPLTASQIGITAIQGDAGVDFGLTGPFSSPLGVTTVYRFDYLIDPDTEVIITYGLSFDDSTSSAAAADAARAQAIAGSSIAARICVGAAFTGGPEASNCRGFFAQLLANANNRNPLVFFPFATNIVDVNLVMTMQGGSQLAAVSSRSGFTPEPRLGIAGGLVMLALIWRERSKARRAGK